MGISNASRRLAFALVASSLFALPLGASAEPVGFVARTEGTVDIQKGGNMSWAAAAVDADVEIGDTIRTGPDSMAKILLVDDTTLTVHDETVLQIDKYVVGPAATRETSILKLTSGHVKTRVGEAFGGTTRLEMHTPTAVIGVKGTVFSCWVYEEDNETNSLCCTDSGATFMRNADPSVSGTFDVPAGECAAVLPGYAPKRASLPPWLGGTPPVESGPNDPGGNDNNTETTINDPGDKPPGGNPTPTPPAPPPFGGIGD